MCEMSVLEGLWGKNTDKEGVAGGRVNAQAFSSEKIIFMKIFRDWGFHHVFIINRVA